MVNSVSLVATLVVLASVAGAVPVAALGVGATDQAQVDSTENGNDSMAPGERLSGVVGAEKAAVQGEVDVRAFGQRIAAARSNASKASVVGAEVEALQERLAELEAEKADLVAAHENGSLSTGQYRARLAQIHAEQRSLERRANSTEAVARGLPAETLREKGVNVSAIRTLKAEARNLTGPEVASIARNISGKNAGAGMAPEHAGPPDVVANRTNGTGPGNAPGQAGDRGPSDDANETDGADGAADANGTDRADNSTDAGAAGEQAGNETAGNGGGDGGSADGQPAGDDTSDNSASDGSQGRAESSAQTDD